MPIKFYTASELLELLLGEKQSKKENTSLTFHHEGPGQLHKQALVFGESETPWVTRTSNQQSNKLKVIFVDLFLREQALDETRIGLLVSLIQFCDVYVWKENNTTIRFSDPLTLKNFKHELSQLKPAKQIAIENVLLQQGLAATDFIILDHEAFSILQTKAAYWDEDNYDNKALIAVAEHIDLSEFDLSQKSLLQDLMVSIEVHHIKSIKLLAPSLEEINWIKSTFPYLQQVEIVGVTSRWTQQYLAEFNYLNITLSYIALEADLKLPKATLKNLAITFPEQFVDCMQSIDISAVSCASFTCENGFINGKISPTTQSISAGKISANAQLPPVITNLKLSLPNISAKQASSLLSLKSLILDRVILTTKLNLAKITPNLETLYLTESFTEPQPYFSTLSENLILGNQIKFLTLKFANTSTDDQKFNKIFPFQLPNLEKLHMDASLKGTITAADLSHFTTLKTLTLSASITGLKIPNNLKKLKLATNKVTLNINPLLEECEIKLLDLQESKINLTHCKRLRKLSLEGSITITGLDVLENIETISLKKIDNAFSLNVTSLKNLTISKCPNITLIGDPANLKYLNIDSSVYYNQINSLKATSIKELALSPKDLLNENFNTFNPQLKNNKNLLSLSSSAGYWSNSDLSNSSILGLQFKPTLNFTKLAFSLKFPIHLPTHLAAFTFLGCSGCDDLLIQNLKISDFIQSIRLLIPHDIPKKFFKQLKKKELAHFIYEKIEKDVILEKFPDLQVISLSSDSAVNIKIQENPNLKKIRIEGYINHVEISNCPKLQEIIILANRVNAIRLGNAVAPRVIHIDAYSNELTLTQENINNLRLLRLSSRGSIEFPKNLQCPPNCVISIDNKQIELTDQIQKSFVSHAQLISETLDGKTSSVETLTNNSYLLPNGFGVTIKSIPQTPVNHYRLGFIDQIKLSWIRKIPEFISDIGDTRFLIPVPFKFRKDLPPLDYEHSVGYLECNTHFQAGKFYPLGTSKPAKDTEMLINLCENIDFDNAELFCRVDKQLFFIKFNKNTKGKIAYYNTEYSLELNKDCQLIIQDNTELLPQEIIEKIENDFKEFLPLQFLFDQKISISEKLKEIICYCQNQFKPTKTDKFFFNGLNLMIDLIKNKEGHCRQVAESAMILGRYLGIPIHCEISENHMWIAIPFKSKSTGKRLLKLWDLGGSETLDLTPEGIRTSNLPELLQKINAEPAKLSETDNNSQLNKQNQITVIKNTIPSIDSDYSTVFKKYQTKSFDSLDQLLNDPEVNTPLIEIPPITDAYWFYQKFKASLKGFKKNYLYVDNAKELNNFFKPYRLENGERMRVDGPLMNLLQEGGYLLINWNHFSSAERVKYQSMMDDNLPHLNGEKFAKDKIKIIGLLSDHSADDGLVSRCQKCKLNKPFWQETDTIKPVINHSLNRILEELEIDLYHQFAWEDLLLGDIQFSGHQILLQNKELMTAIEKQQQAIKEGKNLIQNVTIYNPPFDIHFVSFIKRLQIDKQFFYNGKWINLPDGLNIQTKTRSYTKALPENVNLNIDTPPITRKPIHLHISNWHEIFSQQIINGDHGCDEQSGLLNKSIDEFYFYITGNIPENEWQFAMATVRQKYPGKKFTFYLAPQASIQNIKTNDSKDYFSVKHPVFYSNDIDFCTYELQQQYPESLVIDITPQMTLSDLLVRIWVKKRGNLFDFYYQEQALLTALKRDKSKTIILNGAISSTLYAQLLPLLTQTPYYNFNGDREEKAIKAQLILVQPIENKAELSFVNTPEINKIYNFEEYKKNKELYNNDSNRHRILHLIEKFYQLAQQWPQGGKHIPSTPPLSFSLLKHMVYYLENKVKFHKHNPIKGLFHYNYMPNTPAYAYFNVLAKYYFSLLNQEAISATPRLIKLKRLTENFDINDALQIQQHSWQLLNCLTIQDLLTVLGNDRESFSVEIKNGLPQLNKTSLEQLKKIVGQYLNNSHNHYEEKKINPSEKQAKIINDFIKDYNKKMLFLKGNPGFGKTYALLKTIKQRKDCCCYAGEKEILKWLDPTQATNATKILLLNEFNFKDPGSWDSLKGIIRDGKGYYKGNFYCLQENQKIVLTGNSEYFENRFFHPFVQHNAEILFFKKPSHDDLKNIILKPILATINNIQDSHFDQLLSVCEILNKYNPYVDWSIRHVTSLARRFNLLATQNNAIIDEALLQAAYTEFAGTIFSSEARKKFMEELQMLIPAKDNAFQNDAMISISDNFVLPPSQKYIYDALRQNLLLRDEIIKNHDKDFHKLSMLIQGPYSRGKTTFYLESLYESGFRPDHPNSQKRFLHITNDTFNARKKIIEAFMGGSILVIDELNIENNLEELLNDLLEGNMEKLSPEELQPFAANPLPKLGFMILASQNPGKGNLKGRKSLSQAFLDRFHFNYVEEYSSEELQQIAKHLHVKNHLLFTEQYQQSSTSQRAFFKVLNEVKKTPSPELLQQDETNDSKSVSEHYSRKITINT